MRNRAYICLLFFVFISSSDSFKPLGTPPPPVCQIYKYDCPSHYLCIQSTGFKGHCKCHRYFGFFGPECRHLSVSSYLLVIYSCIGIIAGMVAFGYNIALILLLRSKNKLKPLIWKALLVNTMAVVPCIMMNIGYIVTVFESLDPNMFFHQHIRGATLTACFALTMLTSLGISLYWIELVEKMKGKKTKHNFYKKLLYGITGFWVLLTLLFHFIYDDVGVPGLLGTVLIGYSYHYGGKIVVKVLRRTSSISNSQDIAIPSDHVLELARAVEITVSEMRIGTILISLAFVVMIFTLPAVMPLYPQQNHLPRWAQGQVAIFVVMMLVPKLNMHIAQYFHFGALRDTMQFVPFKGYTMFQILANFTTLKADLELRSSIHGRSISLEMDEASFTNITSGVTEILKSEAMPNSFQENVSGVFLIGPQAGPDNDRMLRVRVPEFKHSHTTEHLENFKTLMPLALVTVISSEDESEQFQVVSRIVVDYGDGTLDDVDMDEPNNSHTLSPGAHAFVRCYGESFLRCTLDSFEFGCAGGHPLLASFSQVLMAGEIEVDEAGVLTRWLNKSGLYMPPKFMMGQSGLPFALAWVYVSEQDLSGIDPLKKESLIQAKALVNIVNPSSSSIPNNSSRTSSTNTSSSSSSASIPRTPPYSNIDNVARKVTFNGGGERSVHASDTWIMKANDDMVWQPTISTSAYQTAKEAVARFNLLKRQVRRRLVGIRNRNLKVVPLSPSSPTSSSVKLKQCLEFNNSDDNSETEEVLEPEPQGVFFDWEAEEEEEDVEMDEDYLSDDTDKTEDEIEEDRQVLAKIKAIKREMIAAGVFDTHRQGAAERVERKSELGFSRTLEL